ncbi:hypothetical protein ABZ922_00710 [Streptomyces shenzhenensis]|uniref:hypothetical protein n=1 Tax=Streptomyces shenzhenensis TaxID=943815 RepID=UPI0033E834D8
MRRPTPSERAAAREAARADKVTIIERYRAREPVSRIADAYGVTSGWLALRLDEWGVPRRQCYEAHLHRRRPSACSADAYGAGPEPKCARRRLSSPTAAPA